MVSNLQAPASSLTKECDDAAAQTDRRNTTIGFIIIFSADDVCYRSSNIDTYRWKYPPLADFQPAMMLMMLLSRRFVWRRFVLVLRARQNRTKYIPQTCVLNILRLLFCTPSYFLDGLSAALACH